MPDSKKHFQLHITLPEPVVFLRCSDPSGRHQPDPNDPPTLVRGILNLNVVKPIDISSIDVELTGVLMLKPPEELSEKHKIYSSAVTVFRADKASDGRRPASVGPGLSTTDLDDDMQTTLSRPPSWPRWHSERRSSLSVPPELGPTPPYISVAQSPTPCQSRLGTTAENIARTLQGQRHAPRELSERQAHQDGSAAAPPSSHSHFSAFSQSSPTTQSDTSSASHDSLHQENDGRTHTIAHTSPPFEGSASCHNTAEEHLPSHPSRPHSLESTHGTQPHTCINTRDSSNALSGRSRLRLSLGSVLDAVMEVASGRRSRSRGIPGSEERERGRTRVRIVSEESGTRSLEAGEGVAGAGNGAQVGTNAFHPSGNMRHREHHLRDLGRVLGLEHEHEHETDGEQKLKGHGEGWREFKPGTYSYPISFLLPPDITPTFCVPHGSLNYVIKAVGHRPGAFTSKLSCQAPLLVVAAPTIGAAEVGGDPGPIFVQKQWDGKLAYSFGLSSRWFVLGSCRHLETDVSESVRPDTGSLVEAEAEAEARAEAAYGTAILDVTLLPLEKVKVWRLSVFVDQRTRYIDARGTPLRDDAREVKLLAVEDACSAEELAEEERSHANKHKGFIQIPLLPTPISPHRSPLLRYVPPSADPSTLAGPGPYALSISIGLPGCNDPSGSDRGLHFTMKHKSSSVKVEHFLRLVMRVEQVGDEGTHDRHEGDKKRLFDVTVKTPITVLSCRCVPEYHALPRYSQLTQDDLQHPLVTCACQPMQGTATGMGVVLAERGGRDVVDDQDRLVHSATTPGSRSSFESEDDGDGHVIIHRPTDGRSRSSSRARRSLLGGGTTPLPPPPPPHPHPHHHSHSQLSSAALVSRLREAGWRRSFTHAQPQPHSQDHPRPPHRHRHHHSSTSSAWTTPVSTPHASRPPSPLAQYERLVSGLESEAGDAPPSYESVASGS